MTGDILQRRPEGSANNPLPDVISHYAEHLDSLRDRHKYLAGVTLQSRRLIREEHFASYDFQVRLTAIARTL